MQRLMTTEQYRFDEDTMSYNGDHITQLVKNYRNHPHILATPNRLFYKNVLEAKATGGKYMCTVSYLPLS